jgi:pyruvate ferredoxin oxidoreductase delta subunit
MTNNIGWDEVNTGAVLSSFSNEVNDVASVKPEERNYANTNSFTKSSADWRVVKPVYNDDLCIHCQNCWVYCPDSSIISRDKKMTGIDYVHCKGCGICVEVCPTNPKSLWMFPEADEVNDALTKWPEKKEKKKD